MSVAPRNRIADVWLSTPLGRALIGAGLLAVVAALVVPSIAFIRAMSPEQPATTQSQVAQAPAGASITAVARLDQRNQDGTFNATFLQSEGANAYQATATRLLIRPAPDLTVVMGSRENLVPGAIVQVSGRATGGTITAHRAVVLTSFATVRS